jgi:hypothetical protein
MEKLVYVLRAPEDRPGAEIREALIGSAAPRLREAGATELVINVQDEAVAEGQPMRGAEQPIRAMAHFWLEDANEAAACEQALVAESLQIYGFLVVESRPMVHERPRGARTPGMNQVTCIARRADLSYDEFRHIWHGDHKKVAFETQSTTGYVRNVVVRALTPDAPKWDAIVEETFPIEALTSPRVFYDASSDEELKQNVDRMMASCRRFLDFKLMEMTHMSEYSLA